MCLDLIDRNNNPDFLNDFLDYSATILNKSANTIKEYNYDISHFLKFIKYKFNLAKLNDDEDIKTIHIEDLTLDTVSKIKLEDIHSFLAYLKTTYRSKPATLARKTASIRVFFNYLCNKSKRIPINPAQDLESPKLDKTTKIPYFRTK